MAPPVTPSPHRFMIKNDTPGTVLTGSQFKATPRFNFTPASQINSFKDTPKFVLKPLNFQTLTENKSVKNDIPKFSLNSSDFQASTGKKPAQNEIPKFVMSPELQVLTGKKLIRGDSIEIESANFSESDTSLNEDSYTKIRSESESKRENSQEPASKRRKKPLSLRSIEKPAWLKNEADKLRNESNDLLMPLPATPTLPSTRLKKLEQIKTPRFLISSPDHMLTSSAMKRNLIFAKPPVFRPPDPTTQQEFQSDPNPDLFSPHRRGDKYITGGIAAELRNWLVNIKSSIPSSQKDGKDSWLVEILVEDFNGSSRIGMILVKGRRLQTTGVEKKDIVGDVKIILACEIFSIALQKSPNIEIGKIIGIKGPIWDVTIGNEKWAVGVDWKVI